MIIGIDIRVLGGKVKSGIEEYTENLLARMLPLGVEKDINFKLFYSSYGDVLPDYQWLHLPNVQVIKKRIPNKILFASSLLFNYPKIDKYLNGVDTYFSPHFFLTSLSPSCKHAITFHDLSYERFPEFFSVRKNIWHNLEMRPRWQSQFSDKIIAVSESTKNDLINIYSVDPAKVEVIYSGINPTIKRLSYDEIKRFREDNSLSEEFILFVGKLEPRKNIVSLIRAFDIIRKNIKYKNLQLVIVGARGWLADDMFTEINRSINRDNIIIKNYINDNQRSGYYSCASIFVYPSFFEGFGFPPLEAMACGVPVITSFNSALPEVAGGGAVLVDSSNTDDIVIAIDSILSIERLRERLARAGSGVASYFSWNTTAKKTLEYLLK